MLFIIYGLRDPRTNEIRYVGKSTRGLLRTRDHSKPYILKKRTHRSCWISELRRAGFDYEAIVLEVVAEKDQLDDAERRWIAVGRAALGDRLTNETLGGDGGPRVVSDATRLKISKALKGKKKSAEHIASVTAALKDKRKEIAVKISVKMRGRAFSPEHRRALAAANRMKDPAARKRHSEIMSEKMCGKFSDEHRKAISLSMKERWRMKRG